MTAFLPSMDIERECHCGAASMVGNDGVLFLRNARRRVEIDEALCNLPEDILLCNRSKGVALWAIGECAPLRAGRMKSNERQFRCRNRGKFRGTGSSATTMVPKPHLNVPLVYISFSCDSLISLVLTCLQKHLNSRLTSVYLKPSSDAAKQPGHHIIKNHGRRSSPHCQARIWRGYKRSL